MGGNSNPEGEKKMPVPDYGERISAAAQVEILVEIGGEKYRLLGVNKRNLEKQGIVCLTDVMGGAQLAGENMINGWIGFLEGLEEGKWKAEPKADEAVVNGYRLEGVKRDEAGKIIKTDLRVAGIPNKEMQNKIMTEIKNLIDFEATMRDEIEDELSGEDLEAVRAGLEEMGIETTEGELTDLIGQLVGALRGAAVTIEEAGNLRYSGRTNEWTAGMSARAGIQVEWEVLEPLVGAGIIGRVEEGNGEFQSPFVLVKEEVLKIMTNEGEEKQERRSTNLRCGENSVDLGLTVRA